MDITGIRKDFPELEQKVHNHKLIYFDNAATSLKPFPVIEAIEEYYSKYNSNVHRAGHKISSLATIAYENARKKVAKFINAESNDEIIFTRGTTESINFLTDILQDSILNNGDEVVLTVMEHHSNIVPWVELRNTLGIDLKIIDINDKGELDIDDFGKWFSEKTKVLSITHSSNVLGTINPLKKIIKEAKKRGVVTIVDGAQGIVHSKVDVQDIDCDFYCFSGHKIYGAMGIGVLYGKRALLEVLPPYQQGGGMIEKVSFDNVVYSSVPYKFEAGTPNVGGAIALRTAIDYIESTGLEQIIEYEKELLDYATQKLLDIEHLTIYGTAVNKDPIISFGIAGIHHYDLSTLLDGFGIAMRSGHHCAQPLMNRLEIDGTSRISFSFYNTFEEIDYFTDKIKIVKKMLI